MLKKRKVQLLQSEFIGVFAGWYQLRLPKLNISKVIMSKVACAFLAIDQVNSIHFPSTRKAWLADSAVHGNYLDCNLDEFLSKTPMIWHPEKNEQKAWWDKRKIVNFAVRWRRGIFNSLGA